MARILVVDDDAAIREMVALTLEKSGHAVVRAADATEASNVLEGGAIDLLITDIYMPGDDGLALLERLRASAPELPVLIMTARGSIETVAGAARAGAFDYLAKPFDLAVLGERVRKALEPRTPAGEPEPSGPASMIVGAHPAIVEVYKAVAKVAALDVPVLILGETGTGKELVARALHRFGRRPAGPFVPVNCGAIPDTLLESELFGHLRGAFTDAHRDRRGALAQADGGTVFLDEIGDISAAFQVKLLRFLEDHEVRPLGAETGRTVSVRVLAATHRDVAALVASGAFRSDLYFRLAGYEIRLPALRDRLTDLPLLVEHFRRRALAELGIDRAPGASRTVLSLLAAYDWPGNVRQLEQVVVRLLIDAGTLADDDAAMATLAEFGRARADGQPLPPASGALGSAQEGGGADLDTVELRHILAVLRSHGGNRSAAARTLGISRKTLSRKLTRAGIGFERMPDREEGT